MTTEANLVGKLSPRQRECLALVYHRKTSKEIAIELGIDRSTVDNYIAEAMRLLGSRNRRQAAEQLAAASRLTPSKVEGQSSRVENPTIMLPNASRPETVIRLPRLPFRTKGTAHNDLTTFQRLVWIPAIAIGIAIGFGMLVIGLRTIGDIVAGAARQ